MTFDGDLERGRRDGPGVAGAQGAHRQDLHMTGMEGGQEAGSRGPSVGPLGTLEQGSDMPTTGWRQWNVSIARGKGHVGSEVCASAGRACSERVGLGLKREVIATHS